MDTSLNMAQHKQELLCGKYLALVGMCMLLRNLSIFIQFWSISKSRFSKINTNSDITPPNNLDVVTFEFLLAWDSVPTKNSNDINQFGLQKQGSCTSRCN
jgi:hypothetical protein